MLKPNSVNTQQYTEINACPSSLQVNYSETKSQPIKDISYGLTVKAYSETLVTNQRAKSVEHALPT